MRGRCRVRVSVRVSVRVRVRARAPVYEGKMCREAMLPTSLNPGDRVMVRVRFRVRVCLRPSTQVWRVPITALEPALARVVRDPLTLTANPNPNPNADADPNPS